MIEVNILNKKYQSIWTKIGLNILYYRKERRLTQAQLAEMVGDGITPQYLQRIETAVSSCRLDILIEIAQALDIPLYKLFEFKE